jgi:hypothetical protein
MATFCILVAPLPFNVRKRVFSFLRTSSIVAKIAYALKISFMCVPFTRGSSKPLTLLISSFVAILFADALQRMFRISAEVELAKSGKGGIPDVRAETNIHARKF